MKSLFKSSGFLLAAIVASAVVLLGSGCATLDKALLNGTPEVSTVTQTNLVPSVATRQEATVSARADGSLATNFVTVTRTNFVEQVVTKYTTNTVFELKPGIVSGAKAVETANSMLNPTPSAPLVNIGIEAGLALLAGYVSLRNKKYAEATKAIIQGIETASTATPALAPIKQAISDSALDQGVADFVSALVEKHTSATAMAAAKS